MGTMAHDKVLLRPLAHYQESGVTLRVGQSVVGIDPASQRVWTADGASEPYDALIVATGARARRLAVPGGSGRNVFYLRTIDDAVVLRQLLKPLSRLVVVGAGLIGLEIAASAKALGCAVTVLEAAAGPLQRVLPASIARFFTDLHLRHDVDLRFDSVLAEIVDRGDALLVETADQQIEADLVAIGIGVIPNEGLAIAAGLKVSDGVVVDEFGRTSDPVISAAGDVTRHYNPILGRHIRLESWQNAQNQGIAVGANVGGIAKPYAEVPWFWSDQFDVNLQVVGAPLNWEEIVWRGDRNSRQFMAFSLQDRQVVGAAAVNSPRDVRFARLLIERRVAVSASDLSDPAVKLAELCKPLREKRAV